MPFEPLPEELINIGTSGYVVCRHPTARWLSFAQEGRKGTIYQLRRTSDDRLFALKVFFEKYRDRDNLDACKRLLDFSDMPGMSAGRREVLIGREYRGTLKRLPELEYGVLMPWVAGSTWHDIIQDRSLTYEESLKVAQATAIVLQGLEAAGLAHCDIASGNVLVDFDNDAVGVELVDLEDMYAPAATTPSYVSQGTDGYQHRESRTSARGQWCVAGDRFSGAVLLGEMIAWHCKEIRDARWGDGHFFAPDEVQDPACSRYRLMVGILSALSPTLADLFRQAWLASTLAGCPTLDQWSQAIAELVRAPSEMARMRLEHALLSDDLLELGQMLPLLKDRTLFPKPVPVHIARDVQQAADGERTRNELLDLAKSASLEEVLQFYDSNAQKLRHSSTMTVREHWAVEAARQAMHSKRLREAMHSSRYEDEIETALGEAIQAGCYLDPEALAEVRKIQRRLPARGNVRS